MLDANKNINKARAGTESGRMLVCSETPEAGSTAR